MTEVLTLEHVVAGGAVAGPPALTQTNPADPDDLRVEVPEADARLIANAADAAREAVGDLQTAGVEARADGLARVGRMLMADADALAELIARETGKVLGDARGEVVRAARIFDFFAGEALRNVGERFASTRPGVMVEVDYAPVGVVGLITPWNFPIAIPAWKIAPALSFGNAVVWKPSEVSSATAAALMAIIRRAVLPPGVVNMVLGGGAAGAAVIACEGVDAISFTGSERTGAAVRRAALERGVRVQAEMGGVNGLIILADADLDNAIDCAINGAFFAAGQRCTATSRILVEAAVADEVTERLLQRMGVLVMADPRAAGAQVGPLASLRQKATVTAQLQAIEATGLRPVVGGSGVDAPNAFFKPTLFVDAPLSSPLSHEEIFGPVAALFRVDDFDAAIAALNVNRFGLSAGLCTTSLARAEAFKLRAQAGMLMINQPTAGVDYHAPFGGVAASSYGPREQGRQAREFYTSVRTTYQLPL